jgi:hypothetical protein
MVTVAACDWQVIVMAISAAIDALSIFISTSSSHTQGLISALLANPNFALMSYSSS